LIGLYFLRNYPTRGDLERAFDFSKGWIAAKCWEWVVRLAALQAEKIVLNYNDANIWVMTVDGTHVWVQNWENPIFSQDPKYYSHKYNKSGMTAELGIDLNGGLVWLNGPFPAATSDIQMFRMPGGLGDTLRTWGRKCIADRGYRGKEDVDVISTPNPHDSKPVALFKRRALNRHENFNSMTKVFKILSGQFRHTEKQFCSAFRAICVLCQYKLENETPLYDVLIPAVIDGGAEETEDDTSEADVDANDSDGDDSDVDDASSSSSSSIS
jgi:DDE superfamily endonuclease